LLANSSKPVPEPFGQCVIMYDRPNYKGNFEFVCYENEGFNLDV
jgi:hypothetical protein